MKNIIKHTIKGGIIAILLLVSCGRNKNTSTNTEVAPKIDNQNINISIEALQQGLNDTLRFGVMNSGEIIVKQLQLTNTDTNPMVLLRHVTSCGCTTIEYDRKPILPNEKSILKFEYDSRSQNGWQMKLMELYFANSDSPLKIYIEAEVE